MFAMVVGVMELMLAKSIQLTIPSKTPTTHPPWEFGGGQSNLKYKLFGVHNRFTNMDTRI